jgi:hypothetical protein
MRMNPEDMELQFDERKLFDDAGEDLAFELQNK